MNIFDIASVILLAALSIGYATEEYIPDSHFEAVDMSPADSPFTSRVSIQPLNDIVIPQDNSTFSPGKNYHCKVDEIFVPEVGYSSIVTIVSQIPNNGTIITVKDHKSGGVHTSWINDKYLACQVWIGHIACLHFIFDCDNRAVVTCDMEYFDGDLRKQQRAESQGALKSDDERP